MQAAQAYLSLRGRLLSRQLREVGWLRLLVLLPMLLLIVGRGLLLAAAHPQGQWGVPMAVLALLASAHRQRTDLLFLATCAPAYRQWLALEYLLCALPAALVLLFFKDGGAAALTLLLVPLAAALPPAREAPSTRHKARSLFRSEAFEWVSGMRIGGWAWVLLLAGAAWQHASPLGPMLALGGWLLVILACYGVPEPVSMLMLAARTPDGFLGRRLLFGLGYAALTGAPFLGLLAAGPAGIAGAIAVGIAWLGLIGLIILAKYAFYPVALHIRCSQALVVGVAVALPGNPVYPVLLLVAVGGLILQCRRRLRRVLSPTIS